MQGSLVESTSTKPKWFFQRQDGRTQKILPAWKGSEFAWKTTVRMAKRTHFFSPSFFFDGILRQNQTCWEMMFFLMPKVLKFQSSKFKLQKWLIFLPTTFCWCLKPNICGKARVVCLTTSEKRSTLAVAHALIRIREEEATWTRTGIFFWKNIARKGSSYTIRSVNMCLKPYFNLRY